MTARTVLIVEDEEKISTLLRDYLQQSGFDTHCLDNGNDVVPWVRKHQPDIVTLDIMLPGRDGLSICRDIRGFSDVPIIVITARVEEIDRLLGLELGADDYVCKPFSPREIVLRVKAILRRLDADERGETRGLQIDSESYAASIAGVALDLTPVEFRLLALLAERPGRVFSRNQLIDRIYVDGRVVSDRTVDTHIKNLRRKLTEASGDEDWIRSIYGVGYRLD